MISIFLIRSMGLSPNIIQRLNHADTIAIENAALRARILVLEKEIAELRAKTSAVLTPVQISVLGGVTEAEWNDAGFVLSEETQREADAASKAGRNVDFDSEAFKL